MEAQINYLFNILNKEIKHLDIILNFLFEKEKYLVKQDLNYLKTLLLKEHKLFLISKNLENSRLSVVELIAKKLGKKLTSISLSNLSVLIEAKYKDKILEFKKIFNKKIELIKKQNSKCEFLLKKSLEIVNFSINIMSGTVINKTKTVYNKNKYIDKNTYQKSILDRKG